MSVRRYLSELKPLLEAYADNEPPQTLKVGHARQGRAFSDRSERIVEIAQQALMAAEALPIKTKPLNHLVIAPGQRAVLLLASSPVTTFKPTREMKKGLPYWSGA